MMASPADRNLLFGILALRMDFISRDALIGAMGAWALAKEKPLGEILVDRGDLAAAHRALLEPLVDVHVHQHGDDPAQSLAAVSSIGSARDALESIADPDVQESVAMVATMRPDDAFATHLANVGVPTAQGTRFIRLRPHAKGGLGLVSVARDAELDRQVALKEIQEEYADHPQSRARFVMEAEVTGKLEHPGIVPIYGLGVEPGTGRPYHAMRFIKGQSLKEAIEAFHGKFRASGGSQAVVGDARMRDHGGLTPPARPKRRFDTLAFRALVGRFLDVCDAIAYAHSRGVPHRDLKPGNVMLGPFGETLVVDWGLAKLRSDASDAPDDGSIHLSPLSGSQDQTVAGSAIGTPAFMSPEQAEGRLDLMGPATDVCGLGAILYQLLTNHAPVEAATNEEIYRRVIAGDVPAPRSHAPAIPKALEAICPKALARGSTDRYAAPRDLRADLDRWLADEPISARRDPLSTRAWRWVRHHRTTTTAAAAVLLAGLIATGIAYKCEAAYSMSLANLNTKISGQNTTIRERNTDLAKSNTDLDQSRKEAIESGNRAEAVTDFLVARFESPDPDSDGRSITIAEVLGRAVEELESRKDVTPATRAAILCAIGNAYGGLGLTNESVQIHEHARGIRLRELGDNHPDTLNTQHRLAIAAAARRPLRPAIAVRTAIAIGTIGKPAR